MHQIILLFFHKIAVESLSPYKGKLLQHGMRLPEKNCGRIVERLCGPSFGQGKIVETFWCARLSGKNRRRIVKATSTISVIAFRALCSQSLQLKLKIG
jgi:hypothetical protein